MHEIVRKLYNKDSREIRDNENPKPAIFRIYLRFQLPCDG
jgi:hypothetical protein